MLHTKVQAALFPVYLPLKFLCWNTLAPFAASAPQKPFFLRRISKWKTCLLNQFWPLFPHLPYSTQSLAGSCLTGTSNWKQGITFLRYIFLPLVFFQTLRQKLPPYKLGAFFEYRVRDFSLQKLNFFPSIITVVLVFFEGIGHWGIMLS